jgi:hypothetical protein
MQSEYFFVVLLYITHKKDTQTYEQLILQFETKKLLKKEQ